VIDFRYHLVSLISVFLALAVGIILGAGPLQGAIGEQLTDQVDALRTERNTLREEIDSAQSSLSEQRRFVDVAGDQLVAGSLDGQRVAVVDVDEVGDDAEQAVLDALEDAGARVVAQESLTRSWTSQDDSTLRDTVAGGLREQLGANAEDVIDDDSDSAELLGAALTLALTSAEPGAPDQLSGDAAELQQLLERVGLVDVALAPAEPADAVLMLSGGTTPDQVEESEDAEGATPDALASVAGTAAALTPTVVAAPTTEDGDLVSTVRSDAALADAVTTVSGIEKRTGQIVVPLAIAATQSGLVDQYGFEEDATVLPPAVEPQTTGDGSSDTTAADATGGEGEDS
jgi:hypothetical protein